MSEIIRISRVAEGHFTTISNHAARNPALSRSAKGLLFELCSHSSGYDLSHKGLLGASSDGRRKLQGAVDELKEHGYLEITPTRNEQGEVGRWQWVVTDDPDLFPLPHLQSGDLDHISVYQISKTETHKNKQPSSLRSEGKKEQGVLSLDVKDGVFEVFDYWNVERHKVLGLNGRGPQMKLTKKRKSKIKARLTEGYSVEELKTAVDAVLASDFHRENGHLDIELICRDQQHVERYLHQSRTAEDEDDWVKSEIERRQKLMEAGR